jgi:Tfp pilus assembly PilM family ATPase
MVPGLDTMFHEKTNVRVERMNPLARMVESDRHDPAMLHQLAPVLGVGVGLALRRIDER